MGDRLRVDYAAVEGLIGDMKGYEGNIEDLYLDMTTTVGSLVSNGYMEAESATAYVEEFKNMLGPDIESLSDLINQFYTQLSQICQNFAEADANIADMLF